MLAWYCSKLMESRMIGTSGALANAARKVMKKATQFRWKDSICGRDSENRFIAFALYSESTGNANFGGGSSIAILSLLTPLVVAIPACD